MFEWYVWSVWVHGSGVARARWAVPSLAGGIGHHRWAEGSGLCGRLCGHLSLAGAGPVARKPCPFSIDTLLFV